MANTSTYNRVSDPSASASSAATSFGNSQAVADLTASLLQVMAAGGGNFASLGGGFLAGTNDSNGAALAYVGPGILRAMDGALANAGTLQASKFLTTVGDGSVEWGNLAANTGLGVNASATTLALVTNGVAALSISASQGVALASSLGVTGATTLAALSAAATSVSTLSSSGLASLSSAAVSGNATVGGTLGVTGATILAALTAAATSVSTFSASGLATLASASLSGTLSVSGATTLAGLTAGATGVSTLSSSGLASLASAAVSGTLGVTGATTLAGLSAGATSVSTLSSSGLATLNAASITTTLSVTGASTLAGLTAGATSVSTLSASGLATLASQSVTGNATVGGTFGVTGATTLAGLSAGASSVSTLAASGLATLASASVTGNATVGGTLSVTGATTLSTLSASGLATFNAGLGVVSGGNSVYIFANGASTGKFTNAANNVVGVLAANMPAVAQGGSYTAGNVNSGAHYFLTGNQTVTLYAGTPGDTFYYTNLSSGTVSIAIPSGQTMYFGGTARTGAYTSSSSAIGSTIGFRCYNSTTWVVFTLTGTWS